MIAYGKLFPYSHKRSRYGKQRRLFLAGIWLAVFFAAAAFPGSADAHATLTKTTPAVNDRLEESPPFAELLFNERLDSGGASLVVLDESSRKVSSGKPETTDGGKGLKLALPKLGEGHYTVSYSVISADGHPISGAYVFTVGDPAPLPDASSVDPHSQVGHSHNHGGSDGLTAQSFLFYAARILYYAGLLCVAGLALWSLNKSAPALVAGIRGQALGLAGKFALIATIAYVFFSLQDLAQGEPLSEWGRILAETTIGRLYIAELLLALAAPFLPKLGAYGRVAWAAVALFAESWSGHAAAFEPVAYTVGLNFVHLAAAALWGAGLVLLLAIWLKERPEAGRFALLFSKWALISFLALWVTGILSTLDFLPSLSYLFFTYWGKWLIAKAALALFVGVTALLIRLRLKKGELPRGFLLKTDVGLLAAIVLTVGILTYQNPLPANEPLSYHQMGTDMHVTLRVTPNAPGDNEFTLKIWLPESVGAGKPKTVQLRMMPLDREEVGYIDVPLEPYDDEELDGFPDFAKSTYRAQGPFLPFAGEWKAQIRVTDANDDERVRETTYVIY